MCFPFTHEESPLYLLKKGNSMRISLCCARSPRSPLRGQTVPFLPLFPFLHPLGLGLARHASLSTYCVQPPAGSECGHGLPQEGEVTGTHCGLDPVSGSVGRSCRVGVCQCEVPQCLKALQVPRESHAVPSEECFLSKYLTVLTPQEKVPGGAGRSLTLSQPLLVSHCPTASGHADPKVPGPLPHARGSLTEEPGL